MTAMPEALALQFEAPTGDRLDFEWWPGAFDKLDPSAPPSEPVWTLGGELDWDEIDRLRTVSARLDDDSLIAVAALRPAGSDGHGDELVAGALGNADGLERLVDGLFGCCRWHGSDRREVAGRRRQARRH